MNPPHPGSLPGEETPVQDTLKIIAVCGNHWCDGQARLLETTWRSLWRSLGKQGCRLYIPMCHLGRLGDSRAAADLRKVSQNDPQEFVRQAATRALEELLRGGEK